MQSNLNKKTKRLRYISNGTNTFNKVYRAVEKIPRGKVSTYGRVAKYTGIANPRVVGYALHANKTPETVPCHRVVNVKGELTKGYAFGGPGIQKHLLEKEGVVFKDNKIDLDRFIFNFNK